MFLKSGSAGRTYFSRIIGVSFAVMLGLSFVGVPAVKAEQSDEMRDFLNKQKLKRKGIVGTNDTSAHSSAPLASGKATTETEVFTSQIVEPMLTTGGVAELQAAEGKYAAIANSGGWRSRNSDFSPSIRGVEIV